MYQTHDLPLRVEQGTSLVRRTALEPEGAYQFASSSTALAEERVEVETAEKPTVESSPALSVQPRPAGEPSKSSWLQDLNLRWHHKLLVILLIGLMLIMAAGSLVVGIEALSHLLN